MDDRRLREEIDRYPPVPWAADVTGSSASDRKVSGQSPARS
ncbi:MAG TPA: hypothetical protein VI011_08055 [Asanoa sp.]